MKYHQTKSNIRAYGHMNPDTPIAQRVKEYKAVRGRLETLKCGCPSLDGRRWGCVWKCRRHSPRYSRFTKFLFSCVPARWANERK